jgi:hypothetical protein
MDPLLAARQPDQQERVIHTDNARTDTSNSVDEHFESHRLRHGDHLPYLPGLVPSDLCLFGFTEGQFKTTHFPDGQALTSEVRRIGSELARDAPINF